MDHGSGRADLYGEAGPVLVLLPGAAIAGKDDPRLVRFAGALVGAGWRVMVPDLVGAKALALSAADAAEVAEAVRHAPGQRVALAAISYAAIPAVLAALEPDVAAKVAVMVAVGPPYDARRVIGFFTTGRWRDQSLEPNAYGKWVFVASNARRLTDSGDRALLEAIARRRMADLGAAIGDLTPRLGPQGRAVMDLLDNGDPARVPELLDRLPSGIGDEIGRLDLAARDLSAFGPEVLVIHGADDRIVPVGEGEALAGAVPRGRFYRLGNLAHADLAASGAGDALTLWRAVYRLLEWRDQMG
jgi:pimeloyl-ACP methyl ester carboxylesterase